MSRAPRYTPTTSFVNDEANQVAGRSIVRTVAVDVELANISATVQAINSNLAKIQRDDDKLIDFLIEPYALSEQTRSLLAAGGLPRGVWAQSTQYNLRDVVQFNSSAFICYTPHLSGSTFNQSGFWISISGDGTASEAAAQAANSAAAAAASEATVVASAASATASADSAAANAATVASSVSSTQNAATSSAASASNAASSASQAAASAALATSNAVLRNHFAGGAASVSSTTLTIQPFQAADSTNSVYISTSAALAKTTANFVQGNGGGLDTGTIQPNTIYTAYAVRRTDTGVSDVVYGLSPTAPNLSAAALVPFTQVRKLPHIIRTNGVGQWEYILNLPATLILSPYRLAKFDLTGKSIQDIFIPLDNFDSIELDLAGISCNAVASLYWQLIDQSGGTTTVRNGASDYVNIYNLALPPASTSAIVSGITTSFGLISGDAAISLNNLTSSKVSFKSLKTTGLRAQAICETMYVNNSPGSQANIKYTNEFVGSH